LGTLASSVRTNNYVQRLGAQIETFIANLANFPEPEKFIDAASQAAQISMSESIPLDMLTPFSLSIKISTIKDKKHLLFQVERIALRIVSNLL
jgi:hypothetical protein